MPYKAPTFSISFSFTFRKTTNTRLSLPTTNWLTCILLSVQSPNAKIGKLPLFVVLRFVNRYFLSFVFRFSVPILFLLHIPPINLYCISITYDELTGFQEEDYDGGRCVHLPRCSCTGSASLLWSLTMKA